MVPRVRVVKSPNRGFAYGNNRGVEETNARYVLLLNPDTEIVDGTLAGLVDMLDARPRVGLVGVRQMAPDGTLSPTIFRFPNAARALGEALFSERWPLHPGWAGERVLDWDAYRREGECDWPLGSFMLVRREALVSAGLLDERFFLSCEEPDLCRRIEQAGWQIRHLPQMTIVHHQRGWKPQMFAQDAYARRQYAQKHFGGVHRRVYLATLGLRHLIRAVAHPSSTRREGARRALRTLSEGSEPPFITPPSTAVTPQVSRSPLPGRGTFSPS
jgi:GT2 family glycosyltransferase